MNSIYCFSGPCGVGKSTLAQAYARHLVDHGVDRQVYVIHGDDFHAGFVETQERVGPACPGFMYWEDILRFNWECMLSVAEKVLKRGLDVVIDYVVEDELPLLKEVAERNKASLYYVTLIADEDVIRNRIAKRGDTILIDRAIFLKNKLENMPENQGHLFDNSRCTTEETINRLQMEDFRIL